MGKFMDKKNEIKEASGKSSRKTFNEQQFNELGTALLNEPGYVNKVVEVKKGELTTKETTPVADLRKPLIGGVLKSAGLDAAEVEKITAEHQYPTLPLYPVVATMIEEYMDADKMFALQRKEDMQASIHIVPQEAITKETTSPQTGDKKTVSYSPFRKVKAKSSCPSNLKTTMK